jgi:hypothetical protein
LPRCSPASSYRTGTSPTWSPGTGSIGCGRVSEEMVPSYSEHHDNSDSSHRCQSSPRRYCLTRSSSERRTDVSVSLPAVSRSSSAAVVASRSSLDVLMPTPPFRPASGRSTSDAPYSGGPSPIPASPTCVQSR